MGRRRGGLGGLGGLGYGKAVGSRVQSGSARVEVLEGAPLRKTGEVVITWDI